MYDDMRVHGLHPYWAVFRDVWSDFIALVKFPPEHL